MMQATKASSARALSQACARVASSGSLDSLLTPRLLCSHLPGDNVSNTGSCPKETDASYKRPSEVKVPVSCKECEVKIYY